MYVYTRLYACICTFVHDYVYMHVHVCVRPKTDCGVHKEYLTVIYFVV